MQYGTKRILYAFICYSYKILIFIIKIILVSKQTKNIFEYLNLIICFNFKLTNESLNKVCRVSVKK